MIFPDAVYEVEFRCQFRDKEEAYRVLPFLSNSLTREYSWTDAYYGLNIYQSGQVLRASSVSSAEETRYYLGWKGPDNGNFANIRREHNEEITHGISDSAIMKWLTGIKREYALQEIIPEIERHGYKCFMSYQGQNLNGRYESLGINVKLMNCDALRWPLLVEMEKIARTEAEARVFETDLTEISQRFQIQRYIVKEEPGTLLYEAVFQPDKQ
jgi:hypothetical protein